MLGHSMRRARSSGSGGHIGLCRLGDAGRLVVVWVGGLIVSVDVDRMGRVFCAARTRLRLRLRRGKSRCRRC